jgi:hypothetical protein
MSEVEGTGQPRASHGALSNNNRGTRLEKVFSEGVNNAVIGYDIKTSQLIHWTWSSLYSSDKRVSVEKFMRAMKVFLLRNDE